MLFNKMRGIFLALTLTLVTGVVIGVPTQARAATEPSEPPKYDRSGCERDGVDIPDDPDVYYYDVDGNDIYPGFYSTNCAEMLVIKTMYFGDSNVLVEGPTFEIAFSTAVTGVEAPNQFSVGTGVCISDGLYRGAYRLPTRSVNTDDDSDWDLPIVSLGMKRFDGLSIGGPNHLLANTPFTTDLRDGETWDHDIYLSPGTWTVAFYVNGNATPSYVTKSFFLDTCHGMLPPIGDPGVDGGSAATPKGGIVMKPTARVVVGKVNSRKVQVATKAKFIRDPRKGKTVTKTFTVTAGTVAIRKFKRAKRGEKFTLVAMVKRSNGTERVVIDRLRVTGTS